MVIGVDGGGTSTDVLMADLNDAMLGSAAGGGSNWEAIGLPAMAAEVARTVDTALTAAGRSYHHVIAGAGEFRSLLTIEAATESAETRRWTKAVGDT